MSRKRYTEELKIEAAKQMTERGIRLRRSQHVWA
jgi:transposase-like protein